MTEILIILNYFTHDFFLIPRDLYLKELKIFHEEFSTYYDPLSLTQDKLVF